MRSSDTDNYTHMYIHLHRPFLHMATILGKFDSTLGGNFVIPVDVLTHR